MFDLGGSTGRRRTCPFLGGWRALLRGDVLVWAPDGTRGWRLFGRRRTLNIIFQERYKRFVTPYVLQPIAISSQPGWFEKAENENENEKVRRLASREAAEMNVCQGTPWSEELDSKELHKATIGDYNLESRGSSFSCTWSQHNPSKHLQKIGVMMV